ncbi:ParA family protein [Pseudonocardia bannensis]|uniref:ParA family protein n=1 Tax=Pseudonocardia bannensis TaxID=630973 RepID=A0A848DND7_9PSEU|nr:ParA family protein [Pseudonocardia bannensis]NMH94262.1 ParA family protein [Pseudonocardia bannensis]
MQVVATLSLKGGVGKTTVALGLAGAALHHGVRTLVVDLDPQANATVALDVEPTTATVAEVLDEPRRSVLRRAIAPSGWGEGLDVLVGAEQTERHNHPDPGTKQLNRLTRALSRLIDADHDDGDPEDGEGPDHDAAARTDGAHGREGPRHALLGGTATDSLDGDGPGPYRLVIIDCPPSLGQLTRSALTAAHRAVLVTDPTMFAVSGVQRAFDAVQTERQRSNPDLQPLGVLINRVRPRNAEHEFRIAELRELFGPLVFTGVLPDRSAIQQAQGACLPIQAWDTPGAREASAVFSTLLGRVLRSGRFRDRAPRSAPPATG